MKGKVAAKRDFSGLWLMGTAAIISVLVAMLGNFNLALGVFVGISLSLAVLAQPRIGLLLIALTIPLEVAGTVGALTRNLPLTIPKILTGLTICATLVHWLRRKVVFCFPGPVFYLFAFWLMACVSLVNASELKNGIEAVFRLATTVMFFFLVVQLADSMRMIRVCVIILIFSSTAASSYALVQRFVPESKYETRYSWEQDEGSIFGVEKSVLEKDMVGVVERSTGLSAHAILLSLNIALIFPLVAACFRNTHARDFRRLLWCVPLLVLPAALMVSYSRTGFVLLVFACFMMVVRRLLPVNLPFLLAVLVISCLLLVIAPPRFAGRVLSPESYTTKSHSVSVRVKLFRAGWDQFCDHVFWGAGYGNRYGIFKYYSTPDKKGAVTPHNAYLQVAGQGGVFTLVLLLLFFWKVHGCIGKCSSGLEKTGEEKYYRMAEAFRISLFVFLASGLVLDLFDKGLPLAWMIAGLGTSFSINAVRRLGGE